MKEHQIVFFSSSDGEVSLPVQFEADTLWLTRLQMAEFLLRANENCRIFIGFF